MLDGAKKNLVAIGQDENYFEGKRLSADSNYHSLDALQTCEDEKVDAYIPDILYRKRDPRFAEQERFKKKKRSDINPKPFSAADFSYDEVKQVYLCPNGKELKCHARKQPNRHRVYDVYQSRKKDCAGCPLRSRCLSKETRSRRYLSIQVDTGQRNLIDEMKEKMDSAAGKKIYARRLATVEPVFANICVHKLMNRFTLRKKRKVDVQWKLYALVHNIGKIHVFGARI